MDEKQKTDLVILKWLKITVMLLFVLIITSVVLIICTLQPSSSETSDSPSMIIQYDNSFASSVAGAKKSVLYLSTNMTNGSAVIIAEDDDLFYAVTNYHVIEGISDVFQVRAYDNELIEGIPVNTSKDRDLALIAVKKESIDNDIRREMHPADIGSSKGLLCGSPVFAVGNSLGRGETVSSGIISGFRRTEMNGRMIHLLQTDAALNPGNSGGGLFDADGELIGLTIMMSSAEDANDIGFALTIEEVSEYLEEALQTAKNNS